MDTALFDNDKILKDDERLVLPGSQRASAFLRMLPSFFVLGTQKSGTSSLFSYLCQHPSIVPPKRKEIFFLNSSINFEKGMSWYKSYFPVRFWHGSKITLDATTAYFDDAECPQRMKALFPMAKFVVIFRNPVDRAFSHYKMAKRMGYEKADFSTAIQQEKERLTYGANARHNYYFQRLGYVSRGRYADYLTRWFALFPREQFLLIDFNELTSNPAAVYAQTLNFLQLPAHQLSEYSAYNRDESNEKIPTETREFLTEYFKSPNQEFFNLIGRNLPW